LGSQTLVYTVQDERYRGLCRRRKQGLPKYLQQRRHRIVPEDQKGH